MGSIVWENAGVLFLILGFFFNFLGKEFSWKQRLTWPIFLGSTHADAERLAEANTNILSMSQFTCPPALHSQSLPPSPLWGHGHTRIAKTTKITLGKWCKSETCLGWEIESTIIIISCAAGAGTINTGPPSTPHTHIYKFHTAKST